MYYVFRLFFEDFFSGSYFPRPVTTLREAALPTYLCRQMQKSLGFYDKKQNAYHPDFPEPTAIQSQLWPCILSGFDTIGIAETGSGKTLAFVVPAVIHTFAQPDVRLGEGPIVLILTPTRELATQIRDHANVFGKTVLEVEGTPIRPMALVGGMRIKLEAEQLLSTCPDFVAATPRKLLIHLERRTFNLKRTSFFVIDEADSMLLMGFNSDLEYISTQIRPDRQTVMTTATWPDGADDICRSFFKKMTVKVIIGEHSLSGVNLGKNKSKTRVHYMLSFYLDLMRHTKAFTI